MAGIGCRNAVKYQIGVRIVELPLTYRTGEIPVAGATPELAWAPPHAREVGELTAVEALHWLITPRASGGDCRSALLGLLMLRHKGRGGGC